MKQAHAIAIDCRKIDDFGIGSYIRHLLVGLNDNQEDELQFMLLTNTDLSGRFQLNLNRFRILKTNRHRRFPFQGSLPAASFSLFHAPHYITFNSKKTPSILTVHDLIHLNPPPQIDSDLNPESFNDLAVRSMKTYYHLMTANLKLRSLLKKSHRLIAVSQTVYQQLIAMNLPPEKIAVIPNCIDNEYFNGVSSDKLYRIMQKYELKNKTYFLYCGNDLHHKNIGNLLAAWHLMHQKGLDVPKLIFCGIPRKNKLSKSIENLGLKYAISMLPWIPLNDMPGVYTGAIALILPSLAEGFGLPVVEAMACGTPVLCSDLKVLREITDECALFFDPQDPGSIVQTIVGILRKHELRNQLSQDSQIIAQQYSPGEFVKKHLLLYFDILQEFAQ